MQQELSIQERLLCAVQKTAIAVVGRELSSIVLTITRANLRFTSLFLP